MENLEPFWLVSARQIQAIAQTGLAYTRDPYDRERYEQLQRLVHLLFQRMTGATLERIEDLFLAETGYATPKIDVRAAVFNSEGRLLLVRETLDDGRWTLPGGWADVNITAAANAAKETLEESGYEVAVTKLAAVWDRSTQGHTHSVFSCYKMFFICKVTGGKPKLSIETSEVAWFDRDQIPQDLSLDRVLASQIERMFMHHSNPHLPTDFE